MSFLALNARRKKISGFLIALILLPAIFLSLPRKTEALFCVAFLCLDPIQDVSGVGTNITTGIDAGTNVVHTALSASQWAKSFVLDGVAVAVARQILRKLTAQTVNWINTGFKGNPGYVTDPEKFFLNIGDNVASQFISNNPGLNNLCTPFKAQVRLALVRNYLNQENNYSCTLDKIAKNYESFSQDFDQGGWDGWFAMTQQNQNNAYGAYLNAQDDLARQIANKKGLKKTELDQGHSFLSFKKCTAWAEPDAVTRGQAKLNALATSPNAGSEDNLRQQNIAQFQLNITNAQNRYLVIHNNPISTYAQMATAQQAIDDAQAQLNAYLAAHPAPATTAQQDSLDNDNDLDYGVNNPDELAVGDIGADGKVCKSVGTVTPGSVIEGQLTKVLGSTASQLEVTQSINQIVSALMTQMIEQVVGGIGSGLRGLSQKDTTQATSRTFLEKMAQGSPETIAEDAQIKAGIDNISDAAKPTPSTTNINLPTRGEIRSQNEIEQGTYGAVDCSVTPYDPACVSPTN